jgi:rod shape-determining protein MreD
VAGATVVSLALQTTLTRYLGDRVAIDLVLVVVVYAALMSGTVTGVLTGTVAGLLQDTLSIGIVGIGGLAKTLVGFLAGVIGTQFIVTQAPSRFVVFFGASLLHALIFIGLYELLGLRDFGRPYGAVLEQAFANAVLGTVAFQVAELLPGAVERRRMNRVRRR